VDTVVLTGNRSDYTMTRGADGTIVLVGPGPSTVTLNNIERLQFGDKVIATNTTADTPALAAAYTMLGRQPEDGGFEFWAARQADGYSVSSLAREIVKSAEFKDLYGAKRSGGFVENLYENFLGRSPTGDEMDYYLGMADRYTVGLDDNPVLKGIRVQERLLTAFLESPEVAAKFIGVVNNGIELSV
jgi:hypothetical protein